jgi:hypothetical protein
MTQDQPIQSILRNRTPILIGVVTVLQVLDWHSTLSAPEGRFETNKLLNWLSQWVSFFCVLSTVKLIFIATLLGGFLYWRKHKGVYELEYTACLSVLALVYGAVVFNNYFS